LTRGNASTEAEQTWGRRERNIRDEGKNRAFLGGERVKEKRGWKEGKRRAANWGEAIKTCSK